MIPSAASTSDQPENEPWVFSGGPRELPTPEEAVAFEEALRAAHARFLETALAEDGMPISAGWRGPEAQPQSPPATDRAETPALDGVANTPD